MSIILIRSTHPTAFRSGKWAVLYGVQVVNAGTSTNAIRRPCYRVYFPSDGAEDSWPIQDPQAGYQFDVSDNLSKTALIEFVDLMNAGRHHDDQ